MKVTIYHNPRCSKSRKTLEIVSEHVAEPEVITYLSDPPSAETLREILAGLGMTASELVRKGEAIYKELSLQDATEDDLIAAMVQNPILIERPIVVTPKGVALGRPPESVLAIL